MKIVLSKVRWLILYLSVSVFLASCGGGADGGAGGISTAVPTPIVSITGIVSKGPVQSAWVDVYTLTSNGAAGQFIVRSNTLTDSYGNWSATIPATATPPFIALTVGGSYKDEYSSLTVSAPSMSTIWDGYSTTASITPLTTAVVDAAYSQAQAGGNFMQALTATQNDLKNQLGFDPLTTPADNYSYISVLTSISANTGISPYQTAVAQQQAVMNTISTLATGLSNKKDITPPVVTAPANKTIEATGVQTQVVLGNATAVDNTAGVIIPSNNAPTTFSIGIHKIVWQATDAYGNIGVALQWVTVQDTTQPVFTGTPLANITVQARGATTPNTNSLLVIPVVTDLFAISITSNAPTAFALGTTSVLWTATDANGQAAQATQSVIVLASANSGRSAMNAGKPTNAKALFANVLAQSPANLEAALGVCAATLGEISGNPALRTLAAKFTTDAGTSLPTSAYISMRLMGTTPKTTVQWARTGKQLAALSVNATLLQDPALDSVKVAITSCINQLKTVDASTFTSQVITRGAKATTWDKADLNAMLSFFYGVRGGMDWARAYKWNTDVDADGIPDTQAINFTSPTDGYTYQYRTVSIDPVKVLNDPTFFILAGGGATLLTAAINDFYSAANAKVLSLTDMYASIARASSTIHAFSYGRASRYAKLGKDLSNMRNVAQGLSATGYTTRSFKTIAGGTSSGIIYGDKLTALTRGVFPVFSYDVAPDLILSKQYNNPIVSLTGSQWNPTVSSTIIVDNSYSPIMAGILGAGVTLDLFDKLRRPIISKLLKDSYGNVLPTTNETIYYATDGTSHALALYNWMNNTMNVCLLDYITGNCGVRHIVQGVQNNFGFGLSMANGQLRIANYGLQATQVVNPATGVVASTIPWTGLQALNGSINGFTSDGINDYLIFNPGWWGSNSTIYKAPLATGSFTQWITLNNNSGIRNISVDNGLLYGQPIWWGGGKDLLRSDSAIFITTTATWNSLAGRLNQPVIAGGKLFDINNSILTEYTLPLSTEFR